MESKMKESSGGGTERVEWRGRRRERSGVRRLAQGHFDTPRVGSNRQPSDCQTTALTS